jgi:four helix bundle protein
MMSEKNITLNKSFEFAVRVVNLYRYLCEQQKEYIISKQVLRSGTSIGANVNEASAAQSKKDFIAKMSIASKEARETKYWIDLLIATNYLSSSERHIKSLVADIEELIKLLTSIVKTSQQGLKNNAN